MLTPRINRNGQFFEQEGLGINMGFKFAFLVFICLGSQCGGGSFSGSCDYKPCDGWNFGDFPVLGLSSPAGCRGANSGHEAGRYMAGKIGKQGLQYGEQYPAMQASLSSVLVSTWKGIMFNGAMEVSVQKATILCYGLISILRLESSSQVLADCCSVSGNVKIRASKEFGVANYGPMKAELWEFLMRAMKMRDTS